jgi:SAM-dependent methyltransferase
MKKKWASMTTNYDPIAEQYKRSKQQAWRTFIEAFTLMELIGDPAGKVVVDIACGEGFYSRLLRQGGAGKVTAVDSSKRMIELARAQEAEHRLGIDYIIGDARELTLGVEYDLAVALSDVYDVHLAIMAHKAAGRLEAKQAAADDGGTGAAVGECAQHRGQVYGLVAPLWEQGKVFADHITQRNLDAAYYGSKLATKLKVMGVELASMGITEPLEGDELIQFTEPKKGTYKKLIVRDSRLVGGILMGDISKAAYLMQAFDRDAPLPEERLSLRFRRAEPEDHDRRNASRHASLQLQRRYQGGARRLCRCGQSHDQGGHGRDPRRQGLRFLQEPRHRGCPMVLRR